MAISPLGSQPSRSPTECHTRHALTLTLIVYSALNASLDLPIPLNGTRTSAVPPPDAVLDQKFQDLRCHQPVPLWCPVVIAPYGPMQLILPQQVRLPEVASGR